LHFDGPHGSGSIVNDSTGTHSQPLQIDGIGSNISALKVNLNISKTMSGQIQVYLASPAGLDPAIQNGPQLINLGSASSGGNFQGTLFDTATATVPTVSGATAVTGTFRAVNPFSNLPIDNQPASAFYIYNDFNNRGSPNGGWELLFFNASNGAPLSTAQINETQ
jgi:hypothetical protein